MSKKKINFFEDKEFGDYISESVGFLIREFKLLSVSLILFVGPVVLLLTYLTNKYGLLVDEDILDMLQNPQKYQNISTFKIPMLLQFVAILQSIVMFTVVAVYIKLYIRKGKGNFNLSDIWNEFVNNIGHTFIGMIIAAAIAFAGFFALFIPGLYFIVVFFILVPIIVFEQDGFVKGLSRSFYLIKGKWWYAFGTYFILFIAVSIVNYLASKILGIFLPDPGPEGQISVISGSIVNIVTSITTAVTAILAVLIYGSSIAQKEDYVITDKYSRNSDDTSDVNIFDLKDQQQNEMNEDIEDNDNKAY